MYKIVRALREVDFRGRIIAGHVAGMVGLSYAACAYAIACMKALKQRAGAEFTTA